MSAEQKYVIRVGDQDFGPVGRKDLRDWVTEGRLLPTNLVRLSDGRSWFPASALEGVFEPSTESAPEPVTPSGQRFPRQNVYAQTWEFYRRGFWTFFVLMLPVGIAGFPISLGSQLILPSLQQHGTPPPMGAALILLGLILYSLVWPLCEGAVTIGAGDIRDGHRILAYPLFVRSWRNAKNLYTSIIPVWCTIGLWFAAPWIAGKLLGANPADGGKGLVHLAISAFSVVMVFRLWASFLFRAQTAVFEGLGGISALQRSRQISWGTAPGITGRPFLPAVAIHLTWVALAFLAASTLEGIMSAILVAPGLVQAHADTAKITLTDLGPLEPLSLAILLVATLLNTAIQAIPVIGCTAVYSANTGGVAPEKSSRTPDA